MTTRYTISIHCDRCGEWQEAPSVQKPSGIATNLAKHLKRQGWSRVTNSQFTDLCPDCLKDSYRVVPADTSCPTCGEDGGTSCGLPNCGLLP